VSDTLKVLDLFSGIGGFSLGLEKTGGFETVAFCEIEKFPRKVLAKHWPDVPIYNDVRELTDEQLKADGISVDVICGGYPCQPFSLAGKRKGEGDDRHLWPEVARLIREVKPSFCIFENVAGHITLGLDEVLSDLEGLGYSAESFVVPACAVNAVHRRDRLWIVAYPASQPCNGGIDNAGVGPQFGTVPESGDGVGPTTAPDSNEQGLQGSAARREIPGRVAADRHSGQSHESARGAWPQTQPPLCGGDDGVSCGLDRAKRLKALGNSVVPQIPEIIGRAILEQEAQG